MAGRASASSAPAIRSASHRASSARLHSESHYSAPELGYQDLYKSPHGLDIGGVAVGDEQPTIDEVKRMMREGLADALQQAAANYVMPIFGLSQSQAILAFLTMDRPSCWTAELDRTW
jgi:hypothetical protein